MFNSNNQVQTKFNETFSLNLNLLLFLSKRYLFPKMLKLFSNFIFYPPKVKDLSPNVSAGGFDECFLNRKTATVGRSRKNIFR